MSNKIKSYRIMYTTACALQSVIYPNSYESFYCEATSKAEAVILCVNLKSAYSIESAERVKDDE